MIMTLYLYSSFLETGTHTHTHNNTTMSTHSYTSLHNLFALIRVRETDVPHPWVSIWRQVEALVSTGVLQMATPVLVDAITGLVPLHGSGRTWEKKNSNVSILPYSF